MYTMNLWVVMLTTLGADALLLWLAKEGYGMAPAGDAKTPIDTTGPLPIVQVRLTGSTDITSNDLAKEVIGFLKERQINYYFIIVAKKSGGTSWFPGVTSMESVPAALTQWDHLLEDEGEP
jgi:hypothetical protein